MEVVSWLKANCGKIPCEKYWLIKQLSKNMGLSEDYFYVLLNKMTKEGLLVTKSINLNKNWISVIVLNELSLDWFRNATPQVIRRWWFNQGKELSEKLKEKLL